MKKRLKLLCVVSLLAAVVTLITACGKWEDTYAELDKQGYSLSVRFDANGGMFEGANDVFVVDVFNLDKLPENSDGDKYTYLLTPDDAKRKTSKFEVSKNGCFLAGWYAERHPRVDDAGQPLDAYGELCSVSGREQGYTYAKPWDFSSPLVFEGEGSYTAGENYMTLYAAWVPYYTFEIYAENPKTGKMEMVSNTSAITLNLPVWDEDTGKMDMKNFPELEDRTFEAAYIDEAMTETAPEVLTGGFDAATGVAESTTIKLYTTWLEGTWYRVYNAKQFKDNSRLSGNYILCADLDFSGMVWAPALTTGEFTGQIIGNGHKISGISVEQADIAQEYGGIFGKLSATAVLKDVTFENVTYKIGVGSRKPAASFGLLTGDLAADATLENVTISGELVVGKGIFAGGSYSIGLVCGNETQHGIDISNITATSEDEAVVGVMVEEGDDRVSLGFNG